MKSPHNWRKSQSGSKDSTAKVRNENTMLSKPFHRSPPGLDSKAFRLAFRAFYGLTLTYINNCISPI